MKTLSQRELESSRVNHFARYLRQLKSLACTLLTILAFGRPAIADQPLFCVPPPPPRRPPCVPENPLGPAQAAARKFITRSGDQLDDGTGTPFRFVSVGDRVDTEFNKH